ncbi:hypothetical protein C2L64_17900 [Paraburkholderia hospita]|uniref:Uncharacterized protein n=1 Tax=Paraburkholderia hospita TaxID=169430 RepID=A0AAN1MK21_9BURK|nr:hypothetical protein C2L64_17900 [Paraburkholderia hospita]
MPARAQKLDGAQTFGRAKKKRAWSPLKTTRYGVSARRPLEEPTTRRDRRRSRFQQRCPFEELRRLSVDRSGSCVQRHYYPAASVLNP